MANPRWVTVLALLVTGLCVQGLQAQGPAPAAAAPAAQNAAAGDLDAEFGDEFGAAGARPVRDPLRGYNRVMFHVNDKLYFWALKPVARTYGFILPEEIRAAVACAFRNLECPASIVNATLQGNVKRAGNECARFGLNSTLGVLGLFDVANEHFQLVAQPEDFGQTLGRYGVGDGVPLVLPLLGFSNLRDMTGMVPDYFLDPVSYIDSLGARVAVRATDTTNYVSLHIGEYESLKKDGLDPYIFIRDAYKQHRDSKIQDKE